MSNSDFVKETVAGFVRSGGQLPPAGRTRDLLVAALLMRRAHLGTEEIEIARDVLEDALADWVFPVAQRASTHHNPNERTD